MREIIQTLVQAAVALLVPVLALAIGFAVELVVLRREARRPALWRGLFVALVPVPALAVLVAKLLPMRPLGQAVLVLMAVCPGAPLIVRNVRSRQGNMPLAVLLTVALSVAAGLIAPLALDVLNALFPWELHASSGALLRTLALSFWLPLAIGAAVRALWPKAAAKLGPIANRLFAITLGIVAVAALVTGRQALAHVSVWTWIAMPIVTLGDLILGDVAGGKDPRDRLTIAYAVVLGNPAIALAVARTSYPELRLGPVIIAYVLVRALLLLPYRFVCTRRLRHATEPHTA